MRTLYSIGCLAILMMACATPATVSADNHEKDDFVRVDGKHFFIGDNIEPYYFIGFNLWYGMNLGIEGSDGDRDRLIRELDRLQDMGVDNLRILAGSEGPEDGRWRVHPAVQNEPGVYDERVLEGLDFFLHEMRKRDMRAVLVLNNFFQWSGGMAQYVSWATGDPIPYPEEDGNTWTDYQEFGARFYKLPEARKMAKDFTAMLIERENHITGMPYKDDPTIMSWQLSNEPRAFLDPADYADWVIHKTSFIKERAPRQLVSLGGEGTLPDRWLPMQFEELGANSDLDYLTAHMWIENWQWYQPIDPEGTFNFAIGQSMGYLAEHVAIAEKLNMPVVLSEFGVGRNGGVYDPEAPHTLRDQYFEIIFTAFNYLASQKTALAGLNMWTWSGEGYPDNPGEQWHPGDTLTGDPPHEMQGWYGVYEKDESTIELIRSHNAELQTFFE